jgi:hypothetical protein
MPLQTGMNVRIRGTKDVGQLIQVRQATNTCVIKLNSGELRKNVPVEDVQETVDTKEKNSPIRLLTNGDQNSPKNGKIRSFEDGDIVRARYHKGNSWFRGKIIKVQRDGTYDIQYDDGDIETKVAGDMIELVQNNENLLPRRATTENKTKKNSYEVGDKVMARFNKGTKLFRGKITRVRLDGTYDIKYEDGDSEISVDDTYIEPCKQEKEVIHQTSQSGKLGIGDLVKARFKKGSKFFAGKITRVHSDGTYDIKYDDGDSESRVEMEYIEITKSNEEDDKKWSPKKSARRFNMGDSVKAKYRKGSKIYPGKIMRVRPDGTYDIKYTDGEIETAVDANLIEPDEEDLKASTQATPKKSTKLQVGDHVKARYKKGTKLFPGKITKIHLDGTYDIRYDDGDTETRVDRSMIETEVSNDTDKPSSPTKKAKSFEVGERVKARYKKRWYFRYLVR